MAYLDHDNLGYSAARFVEYKQWLPFCDELSDEVSTPGQHNFCQPLAWQSWIVHVTSQIAVVKQLMFVQDILIFVGLNQ